MTEKIYIIPEIIIDAKEEKQLESLTKAYDKMTKPSKASKKLKEISEKIPEPIKDAYDATKEKMTEAEIFVKSLELLAKSFQKLEEFAAQVTLSEKQIVSMVNKIIPENEITTLDEICLARSYDLSKLVKKHKFTDIVATIAEGAATGAAGFAGIPFNLALSTFLFYRSVQSIALFYGYDVKNNPAELQIASEVFINAMNPKNGNDSELSSAIAKVMLLTTTTSVKQTVNKGWTKMAEKGGVHLFIVQLRALAHASGRKALQNAGKKGLEKTAFTEVFEQLGKKITQKSVAKVMPYFGAFIGATIDTAQMAQIIKFADTFYNKRFILEKPLRINTLLGNETEVIEIEDFEETIEE